MPANLTLAFNYYKLSAENGYSKGLNALGDCFSRGIGIDIDFDRAIFYYKQAAARNYTPALQSLANLYQQKCKEDENTYKELAQQYLQLANKHVLLDIQSGIG